jgi:hypothetical protein
MLHVGRAQAAVDFPIRNQAATTKNPKILSIYFLYLDGIGVWREAGRGVS